MRSDWYDVVRQAETPPPLLEPRYRDEQVLRLVLGDGLAQQAAHSELAQEALAVLAELAAARAGSRHRFSELVRAGAAVASPALLDYHLEHGDFDAYLRRRLAAALDALADEPWRHGPRSRLSLLAA